MFYRAYVESDCDPKNLQRVQVRVVGVHSPNQDDLPTECLPWAEPCLPITTGTLNNGCGDFDTPSIGDYVWVFFEDEFQQLPHYFAVIRTEKDENKEFKQPKNKIESKINDKKNRNSYRKDRWNNRTKIDENEIEKIDSWNNKTVINKDSESFKDHFGNKVKLDENEIEIENGKETVKITLKKNGDINIWSSSGGKITMGNTLTCSSVNWLYLDNWMTQVENALNLLKLAVEFHNHTGNIGYPTGPGISGATTPPLLIPIVSLLQLIQQIHPGVESKKLQIPRHEDQ